MAFCIALVVFFLALLAAFVFRKRRWSRTLANLSTAVCLCMTLYLFPPVPVVIPDHGTIDWSHRIADILGRLIFSALIVSGAQLRFIWQKPETIGPRPRDPDDGFQLYN